MTVSPTRPEPLIPAGSFIAEWLEDNEMTQRELAERLDSSAKHLNQVINGHKPITPTFAAKLALVTEIPTEYWLTMQAGYDARMVEIMPSEVEIDDE